MQVLPRKHDSMSFRYTMEDLRAYGAMPYDSYSEDL